MEPMRLYDYLASSRSFVLDRVRPLTAEQYGQTFAIGLGSLARTLTHIMSCEWYYVERMMRQETPAYPHWPICDEKPPAFAVLEAAWAGQVVRTRAAIEAINLEDGAGGGWKRAIEYVVDSDDGRRRRVRTVVEDIFTQLVLHEVHHRSQAMNMLRQLGVEAPDIDFNTMNYRIEEMR